MWSSSPNLLRASPNRNACFAILCKPSFFTCEIEDFTGLSVGRYAPVDDQLLGDLLPDGRGRQVAVIERPVLIATGVVRLTHNHEHRELGVLCGQEADE